MLVFGGTSLLIATVRPYKKPYKNNMDALVLATISLVSVLYILYLYLVPGYSSLMSIALFIIFSFPLFGFFTVIIFMVVKKILFVKRVKLFFLKMCKRLQKGKVQENDVMEDECNCEVNPELPDRVTHPELYI